MKVIEIEAPVYPRKAYVVESDEQHFLEFKSGIEVLHQKGITDFI